MCGLMQRENAALSERVTDLSTQVLSLSEQLRPVVVRLNDIEAHREQERAAQHQKALELERSQRQQGMTVRRCDNRIKQGFH